MTIKSGFLYNYFNSTRWISFGDIWGMTTEARDVRVNNRVVEIRRGYWSTRWYYSIVTTLSLCAVVDDVPHIVKRPRICIQFHTVPCCPLPKINKFARTNIRHTLAIYTFSLYVNRVKPSGCRVLRHVALRFATGIWNTKYEYRNEARRSQRQSTTRH